MHNYTLTQTGQIDRNQSIEIPQKKRRKIKKKPISLVSGQANIDNFFRPPNERKAQTATSRIPITRKRKRSDNESSDLSKDKQQTTQPILKRRQITNIPTNRSRLFIFSRETHRPDESATQKAPLIIPYRDDGEGRGPFYDHYTLQHLANRATLMSIPEGDTNYYLSSEAYQRTHRLKFGKPDPKYGHIMPNTFNIKSTSYYGTLVITGLSRSAKRKKRQSYIDRVAHENVLLKHALLIGQPILAICGGAWRLWQHCDGETKEVQGHNCRKMPNIKKTSGKVGDNRMRHRICFNEDSETSNIVKLLKAAMTLHKKLPRQIYPAVNSVHWAAPDENKQPIQFVVSARSAPDKTLHSEKENASNKFKPPDKNSVEAFESRSGAPLLGIQWHPEAFWRNTDKAYEPGHHRAIIQYMAAAGDAFFSRRKMVKQFESLVLSAGQETLQHLLSSNKP